MIRNRTGNRERSQEGRQQFFAGRPLFWVALAMLLVPAPIFAQQLGVDVTTAQQETGTDLGNYHNTFSVEAGDLFAGINGNQ